ncbi:cytochrome c oxidase copper chaperone 1-like [Fagus crenata]|jgi:cytochrome c oxidase assembly protein subunit 17
MSELPTENASSALTLRASSQKQGSAVTTGPDTKPKKKICCACPDTKKLRDECIVEHGEEACAKWIEAHRTCLRAEGFNV